MDTEPQADDVPFMVAVLIICAMVGMMIYFAPANIDCNDPATWGTAQGVQHCAVTPSK